MYEIKFSKKAEKEYKKLPGDIAIEYIKKEVNQIF